MWNRNQGSAGVAPSNSRCSHGGQNILNKMGTVSGLRWLGAGLLSAFLACVMTFVPVQGAFADGETAPGVDPGTQPPVVGQSPSPPPTVDPAPPTTDPGPPVTNPAPPTVEIPPVVIVPPLAPVPGAGSDPIVVPNPGIVPAAPDSRDTSQGSQKAPQQPLPQVNANPGPELEPVAPVGATPTPSPTISKSSSAPAVPSHSPTSEAPVKPASVVKTAVQAATGSPFVVQLITVLILLAAGFVYFRVLGSKGTRVPSKASK